PRRATSSTRIYPLSLHDALPILDKPRTVEPLAKKIADVLSKNACAVTIHSPFSKRNGELRQLGIEGPNLIRACRMQGLQDGPLRSEEHTSELQSRSDLVCRLLLE